MATTNYITANGMLIGEETGGAYRGYGTDALGSVVATYTASGAENSYVYKPYGTVLDKTGSAADPSFLYNGENGYRSTGLANAEYYVRSRVFSSTTALWTTVDPIWPDESAYGYVGGQVVLCSDSSGLQAVGGGAPPPPPPFNCAVTVDPSCNQPPFNFKKGFLEAQFCNACYLLAGSNSNCGIPCMSPKRWQRVSACITSTKCTATPP